MGPFHSMKTWSKNITHWPPSPRPVGGSRFQGSSRPSGRGAQWQDERPLGYILRTKPRDSGLGASSKASCVLLQTQPLDNRAPRRMQPREEQANQVGFCPLEFPGLFWSFTFCLPKPDARLGHSAVPKQSGPAPGQHP